MKSDLPYLIVKEVKEKREYNPDYGDKRMCICGHPYYRHFDSYEDMRDVGCKYCGCFDFIEKDSITIAKEHGSIFTVTTLPHLPHKVNRCVGYFFDMDVAIEEVTNNSMDISEQGYYSYCVIEEVKEGIYFFPRQEIWFKWNPDDEYYHRLEEKPKRFNDTSCFGIG